MVPCNAVMRVCGPRIAKYQGALAARFSCTWGGLVRGVGPCSLYLKLPEATARNPNRCASSAKPSSHNRQMFYF